LEKEGRPHFFDGGFLIALEQKPTGFHSYFWWRAGRTKETLS
jgi:hypothetical protein